MRLRLVSLGLSNPDQALRVFNDIGLKVKLYWEPNEVRFIRLIKARMKMELSEHFMAAPDSIPSHARNPDMD